MNDRFFRILFFGTTSLLYAAFLLLDINGNYEISKYVKYASIIICLAAALYISINYRKPLIAVTASLTLFADTFLLLLNDYYIIGVTAFAIVQTLFGVHIEKIRYAGHLRYIFLPRIIVYVMAVAFISFISEIDAVTLISAWSYINLVFNVLLLLFGKQYNRHISMLAIGMTLFLGCDTCVGLSNLSTYIPGLITGTALSAVSFLMWVFYLPSQVFIISAFEFK